ncbi:hypothetical protein cce_5168 [Crocosphaera subtropica ATCC 51142]|uniref:Uncharacterized protein n=1 Tax=Crocosphaera subtropica (strain ATCC 51142 / BH68) TaxID=43989 RepID=B1X303_CROS5|nr:hypothetical protein cce_5168 [Crocosphaera subtropica ATCC 51142]
MAEQGNWKWIAIPKTIDNDLPLTQQVVEFNPAVDILTKALYNLTFTAS